MTDDSRGAMDLTHGTLSVLALALLAASTFWILNPFLTSILWATVITVAAWPIMLRLQAFLGGRRGLAVALMTAAILLVVFVPVALALATIVSSAQHITTEIRHLETIPLPSPPAWLQRVPFGGERMAAEWARFIALDAQERAAEITPYVQTALQWFVVNAGSLGVMLLQFLLTAIVSAILFAKGEVVRDGLLRFAWRLAGSQGRDVALLAARAIRGVVLGVVGTALIQSAIGGAGLLITGVPAASLLTAVMLFLCLAQLGPFLVLVPSVLWLYWSGSTGSGTALLVISLVAGTLDNFVRPWLIRRGAELPLLLIFAGVIGGLMAFGVIGLFIGPVVLSVTYTLLSQWVSGGELSTRPAPGETVAQV
jgi:predicted PurR-regulated permease PerM